MFSKDKITGWITLAEVGVNKSSPDAYSNDSLRLRFIEAKCQNDRWGNVTTDYIVHSSQKEKVREALGTSLQVANGPVVIESSLLTNLLEKIKNIIPSFSEKDIPRNEFDSLWGANVHYSDNIPVDLALALVLEGDSLYEPPCAWDDEPSCADRCVAVFPV